LIAALGRVGAVRLQKSVWLVETATQSAEQLFQAAWSYMDPNDRLFVLSIEPSSYEWIGKNMLPPSGAWLKARRP
jgi:hypothetical protein